MKDEKFYIHGLITAETLGEICRSLGETFVVYGNMDKGITFQKVDE